MNNWMLLKKKSRIVAACGLVALAVTLAWANQAQAMGYPVGSEEALEASFFDPFSLTTADPFRSSMIRSVAPSRLPVATSVATAAYEPLLRIPYKPALRSPYRPPLIRR